MLLWVALYNGYPTVYPDTGAYLYTGAFLIALPPFRAPGYGIFANWTSLGTSAWFTAIAQGILVVTVLYETCKYLIGGEAKFRATCMLAIVCVLAVLTSLPWEVSLLMPDVFAGMVFLSVFLLAFNEKLRLAERIILAAILTISVSAHMSLLPIAALFVAALVIPRLAGWQMRGTPPIRTTLAWLLVPMIAAGIWTATLNRRMGLGFHLSVSGNEFLLGRLFGDGLAADFLRDNCPRKPFIACRYLNNLPRTTEQFLFWHPLLRELDGHGDELAELVHGTLAAYPLRFVESSIMETLRQLTRFRTGDEIRDFALHAPNSNAAVIQQILPRDFPAFSNSRMIRGRLLALANAAATVDTVVFWLSAAACLVLAWTERPERLNPFLYSAIAFLVINAAICATLAGVYDRYQSRVAWIMPLCFTFYAAGWIASKNARTPENPG
ncbi:MAG: hypothetical protein LAO08_16375 [Acidobacteriia bacterium]|nr:hypothetical protein [Terriglobia bacterium]